MHRNELVRSPTRHPYQYQANSHPSDPLLSPTNFHRDSLPHGVTAAIPSAPSVELRRLSGSPSGSAHRSYSDSSSVLPVSAADMFKRLPSSDYEEQVFQRSDTSAFQHPSIQQGQARPHPPLQHQLPAPTLGPAGSFTPSPSSAYAVSATRKLCETRRPSPVFRSLSPNQPTRAFHFSGHPSLGLHSPNSSAITHSDSISPIDSSLLPPSQNKSASMPSTPLLNAYRPTRPNAPYSSTSSDASPAPVRKNLTPPIPQRRGEYDPSPRSQPQPYRSLVPADVSRAAPIPMEVKASCVHHSPQRTCRQDVPLPSDAVSPSDRHAHGPVASAARMDAFLNLSSDVSPPSVPVMEHDDWTSLLSTYRKTPR